MRKQGGNTNLTTSQNVNYKTMTKQSKEASKVKDEAMKCTSMMRLMEGQMNCHQVNKTAAASMQAMLVGNPKEDG